mmetsp:Transcript_13866/g.35402  ORF Transcript_13866/g.35402 Transcript_13866/m.35402 type:complete len:325 (+) Transcript_13866:135-1109(+)
MRRRQAFLSSKSRNDPPCASPRKSEQPLARRVSRLPRGRISWRSFRWPVWQSSPPRQVRQTIKSTLQEQVSISILVMSERSTVCESLCRTVESLCTLGRMLSRLLEIGRDRVGESARLLSRNGDLLSAGAQLPQRLERVDVTGDHKLIVGQLRSEAEYHQVGGQHRKEVEGELARAALERALVQRRESRHSHAIDTAHVALARHAGDGHRVVSCKLEALRTTGADHASHLQAMVLVQAELLQSGFDQFQHGTRSVAADQDAKPWIQIVYTMVEQRSHGEAATSVRLRQRTQHLTTQLGHGHLAEWGAMLFSDLLLRLDRVFGTG